MVNPEKSWIVKNTHDLKTKEGREARTAEVKMGRHMEAAESIRKFRSGEVSLGDAIAGEDQFKKSSAEEVESLKENDNQEIEKIREQIEAEK
ncbi:MAG: hypothetical protein WCW61_01255 [Patescibacteria group bacterium]|jgi:hypothetical protein